MNKNKEFYNQLRTNMLEERKNYLNQAHTKEEDVRRMWHGEKKYRGKLYFFLDGYRIWMPEYYQYVQQYKKYRFSMTYPLNPFRG